jgi:penicillin V acylase-like amidase (Ntn superfamily)
MTLRRSIAVCLGLLAAAAVAAPAYPCVRVLRADGGKAVVVGRNMNWSGDTKTSLWAFPRGVARDGLAAKNALKWTSKYGSVATGFFDYATADGVNERGLAMSLLWLDEADHGIRDEAVPGLATTLWGQFYLDKFATVAEAVAYTEKTPFQLLPVTDGRDVSHLHLALADATGDSAVVEYVGGKAKVYHDRKYAVMTNSPPFGDQLKNLARYSGFGGELAPPAAASLSADRFVLASRGLDNLPVSGSDRHAVAQVFGLLRDLSLPVGRAPSGTHWRAVADLTNRVFYFESATNPNVVRVSLGRLSFEDGGPVRKLDLPGNPDLGGECAGKFRKSGPLPFAAPKP